MSPSGFRKPAIISISKLLGNYNTLVAAINTWLIISISKLLGNYNALTGEVHSATIISISKLLGNYNSSKLIP